ncbi:MAG: (d)CMP kinase [Lachnospiraceae bacterium]|nr:(d)CMP kinase [Lachnospiraceae bacterium]
MSFNIAIDGPAGAGKSTIAKKVAKQLEFIYVDTGAMYRTMALYCIRQKLNLEDEKVIAEACRDISVDIRYIQGEQQMLLNGENVSSQIRTEQVGNAASTVSAYQSVRQKLTQLQKNLASSQNVVMDGRDIGTAVLPDAQIKIYLTASARTRALRRLKDLKDRGMSGELSVIEADINERDHRDMTREISPLCQAEDALLIDSSQMTAEEVTTEIIKIYEERK